MSPTFAEIAQRILQPQTNENTLMGLLPPLPPKLSYGPPPEPRCGWCGSVLRFNDASCDQCGGPNKQPTSPPPPPKRPER